MNNTLERKLVAIMFTDMVGFTALMQKDESLGLQKRNRHKSVIEELHNDHRGQIVQYFGDGTLSIFSNAHEAVACAVDIQKALKAPIEVPLRIGIHVGNVIIEPNGIIGDAVNIASRIESFANVGGVLISDFVYDQVKNQTQWDYVHLGKFGLKNVHRPFEIYALSCDGLEVPDAKFLRGKGEKIAHLKGDIPQTTTPIFGREKEIQQVIDLLQKHQVVTVNGAGGIGKTRLSLEIGQRLASEFQDGIAFVSMANLADTSEVIPLIATELDIKEAENRRLIDGIAALISSKKALLIVDNLEHVISAAKEIAELATCCPSLRLLCTSRTPLKIEAEREFALRPLPLPERIEAASWEQYPAISLFTHRAMKANRDFQITDENAEAVVEICRRLDGLPLALELAAARIRILPPEKLLRRLERALDLLTTGSKDLPIRHQTLRATIDWSHNLLNDSERKLFRRLGVFSGGFTLEAMEEVCYENEDDVFLAMDELESLLDKGLVKSEDDRSRFSLLQTISDFAIEKLQASGEADHVRYKHAIYFYTISMILNRGTHGENQLARMKQGSQEETNIQVALDYLLSQSKDGDKEAREMGLSICGELFMYWHIRGKHQTAKKYINAFLEAVESYLPSIAKCKALFSLHVATFTLAEMDEARSAAIRGNEMALAIGDELEIGKSYFSMGWGHFPIDLSLAEKYCDQGIQVFNELDHDSWLGFLFWQKGVFNVVGGQLDKAFKAYSKSFELFQKIKNYEGIGCAQSGLALMAFIAGNYGEAIEEYLEALAAFEAVGDRPEEARLLSEIAWTYLAKHNTVIARRYFMDSIQAYREVGSIKGIGLSMNGLAAIESFEGHPQKAIKIASAAEHFAEQQGVVIEFGVNNHGKVYLERAEAQCSGPEVEKAKKWGRKRTIAEVLEYADYEVIPMS